MPSISTGKTISGYSGGLNEEWTKVSSKSKTKVFLVYFPGILGPNKPSPSGNPYDSYIPDVLGELLIFIKIRLM